MNWKKHNFNTQDLNDPVIFFTIQHCIFQISEDHPMHITVFPFQKQFTTCQKEINQHQSASKPKEMNNLSEVSASLKTLSYPALCTPSISKSSNAHDTYCH